MRSIREELIKNAAHLVAENGFALTKVEDITKASNCAKGTFYTYFKTKEDVLMVYFDEFVGKNMKKHFGKDLGDKSSEQILRDMIETKLKMIEENFDFISIVKHIEASPKSFSENLVKNVLGKYGRVILFYIRFVERGMERGEINSKYKGREEELALIIIGMVESIVGKYGINCSMVDEGERCNLFSKEVINSYKNMAVETLFKGIE